MLTLKRLLPVFGKGLLAPVVLVMAMTACSNQDPSFTESTTHRRVNNDDAVARKNGAMAGLPGETHRDGSDANGNAAAGPGPDGIPGTGDDGMVVSAGNDGTMGTSD